MSFLARAGFDSGRWHLRWRSLIIFCPLLNTYMNCPRISKHRGRNISNQFPIRICQKIHMNQLSRVFLLLQLWIVNHYVKSQSNNLSNEKINTAWCFCQCVPQNKYKHFYLLCLLRFFIFPPSYVVSKLSHSHRALVSK